MVLETLAKSISKEKEMDKCIKWIQIRKEIFKLSLCSDDILNTEIPKFSSENYQQIQQSDRLQNQLTKISSLSRQQHKHAEK